MWLPATTRRREDTTNILQGIWNTCLASVTVPTVNTSRMKNALANIYGARDNWELNQQKMALERWKEQQANARQAAATAANFGLQKYMLDRQDASNASARAWQEACSRSKRSSC